MLQTLPFETNQVALNSMAPKSLKQGTLFSFFNKPKAPESNNNNNEPKKVASPQKAPPPPPEHPLLAKLKMGDRIEVYWRDDDEYYAATVTQQRKASYFLEYDDGQTEWLDLAQETFRAIPNRSSNRRHIREEEDDEEEEAEFNGTLESDDDGSVYEQKENDKMQDDDDSDADQWLVSDEDEGNNDEEEDEFVRPPKKKLKVTKHKAPSVELKTPSASARKTTSALGQFGHTPKSVTPASTTKSPVVHTPTAYSTPAATANVPKGSNKVIPFVKDAVNPAGSHVHNHLPFMQNPRDIQRRSKDDPNYDPRTLFVVERDWVKIMGKDMTDAVKQWWDLKSQYFDTVLLFKTGT